MVSPDFSISGNNSNSSNNLSSRGNINSNTSTNYNIISSTTTITTSGGLSSNNAMNIYGTLPKQHSSLPSASSSGIFTSSDITSTDHITSSYYKEFNTGDGGNSNSSSGVSSMAGSTSSYDFYTQQRPSTGGGHHRSGHNYNTIGTYKVQYSSTNPFFDAIEPQQIQQQQPQLHSQRSPYNFGGSNGDEYDDLK